MIFDLLLSAESPIGRFDASMLTDHQMMELFFIPDDTDPKEYCGSDGCDIDDSCTWRGITCSRNGSVLRIIWMAGDLKASGRIDFSIIPRKVTAITFSEQLKLSGEVKTSALPRYLKNFVLEDCRFTGSLDMCQLPPYLKSFRVVGNFITAISAICNLPDSLSEVVITESHIVDKSIRIGKIKSSIDINLSWCGFKEIIYEDPSDEYMVLCADAYGRTYSREQFIGISL